MATRDFAKRVQLPACFNDETVVSNPRDLLAAILIVTTAINENQPNTYKVLTGEIGFLLPYKIHERTSNCTNIGLSVLKWTVIRNTIISIEYRCTRRNLNE